MDEWVLEVIRAAGYLGIVLLMILENIVPMIPSELILPFAGYLAARGDLTLPAVIVSATIGSTIGAMVWFVLGRVWKRRGIERFIARHGHWLLLDVDDVKRAEEWFSRHKGRATFLGRLVPGVRSFISIPAGLTGMNTGVFLLYTVAGTALWTAALTLVGYFLADAYERARDVIGPVGSILFAGVVIVLVVRYMRRRRAAT